MKRITILTVFILLVLLACSGCNPNLPVSQNPDNNLESKTESDTQTDTQPAEITNEAILAEFVRLLDAGEYVQAIDYYQTELLGNSYLEYDAQEQILDRCEEIHTKTLSGEYSEKQVTMKLDMIDKVVDGIDVQPEGYEDILEKIEESLASRTAYSAAVELEALENYMDAAKEYQKVIANDSNYADAQQGSARCIDVYKKEVLDKAQQLVTDKDLLGARTLLVSANEKLGGDSDLQAKITVYEKTYIQNVLSDAEEAFVTPAADYAKALEIVNAALQHFPDHADLSAKKDYYLSYAPVNLYDMKKLKGEADTLETDTDPYGNHHEKIFWSGYSSFAIWNKTDISFYLNKSYNTFSAVVYGRSQKNDVQEMIVRIYGDGQLLYENLNIPDNATPPFAIDLDITGISELRIVLTQNRGAIGSGIGMTDMIVQKTVK